MSLTSDKRKIMEFSPSTNPLTKHSKYTLPSSPPSITAGITPLVIGHSSLFVSTEMFVGTPTTDISITLRT